MRFIILMTVLWPLFVAGQYTNVMIGNQFWPEEPSIMINPSDPGNLVAGANTNVYYFSTDGGQTWAQGILTSSYGVWGDPCIITDTNGHFYYFHLSDTPGATWIDRIVCQKSADGGLTWNDGSYMGLNGTKNQDKEWAIVNEANNHIYVTWTQFDQYGSSNPGDSSNIMFSRSADSGETWSESKRINRVAGDCVDSDNTVEGAVPAVGPNGEIYVAWAGQEGLMFTRSYDGGETWPDTNIFVTGFPGGWDYAIPGIYRANGLPITCCDLSGGPYHGRIYINWSDQRNGTDDTDVWLVKSDDGGDTWSNDIRVNNDPPGKQQFFTWMAIDQSNGYLYFVFYDRRNQTGNFTDVYMAVSRDGGDTFENMLVSESPFNPNSSIFFGDYTNISVYNGMVRPIWTRLDGFQLSIWTALIDSMYVGVQPENYLTGAVTMGQNYPNPFSRMTCIPYKVYAPATVSLKVFDLHGREMATLFTNRFHAPGKYIEQFSLSDYRLSPGFYYFSLIFQDQVIRRKMIID
jgi:hypothetical protein